MDMVAVQFHLSCFVIPIKTNTAVTIPAIEPISKAGKVLKNVSLKSEPNLLIDLSLFGYIVMADRQLMIVTNVTVRTRLVEGMLLPVDFCQVLASRLAEIGWKMVFIDLDIIR